ncbi:MAG: hypothetical protein ACM335_10545, partial [Deltaproteobacteria bacterium]
CGTARQRSQGLPFEPDPNAFVEPVPKRLRVEYSGGVLLACRVLCRLRSAEGGPLPGRHG